MLCTRKEQIIKNNKKTGNFYYKILNIVVLRLNKATFINL